MSFRSIRSRVGIALVAGLGASSGLSAEIVPRSALPATGTIRIADAGELQLRYEGARVRRTEVLPLFESASTAFDVPFVPPRSNNGTAMVVSDEAPLVYAMSNDRLFTVRATDGELLHEMSLGALGDGSGYGGRYHLVIAPGNGYDAERLIAWNSQRSLGMMVFSLAEPERPEFEKTLLTDEPIRSVEPLPGGDTALVRFSIDAALVSIEDGARTFEFGRIVDATAAPAARGDDGATIAILARTPTRGVLTVSTYSKVPGEPPVALATGDFETSGSGIELSSRGRFALLQDLRFSGGQRTGNLQIVDVDTAELVATVGLLNRFGSFLLVDGDDPTLVAFGRSSAEFFDLSDPSSPKPDGVLPIELAHSSLRASSPWDAIVALSDDQDTMVVAAQGETALVAIDVANRSEVNRRPLDPTVPTTLALSEGPAGTWLAVSTARFYGDRVLVRGGLAELRTFEWSRAASAEPMGRFVRIGPRTIHHLGSVGRGRVVAVDIGSQAISLVRAKDGTVLDTTGFGYPFVGNSDYPALEYAENFFAVKNRDRLELFSTVGGEIRMVGEVVVEGGFISEPELHGDGSLFYRASKDGESECVFRSLDGVEAVSPICGPIVDRSADGTRALIDDYSASSLCLIDLSNATPETAWCRDDDAFESMFFDGGRKVFQSHLGSSRFSYSILDSETGEPIGADSETHSFWLYAGQGTFSEAPGAKRVLRWRRVVFSPWVETLLYGLDGATPELLAIGPRRWGLSPIGYAPRAHGGWLEIHVEEFFPRTRMFLGEPDGEQTEFVVEGETHRKPIAMERGRFATAVQKGSDSNSAHLTFWVDSGVFATRPASRIEFER